MSSTIKLYEHNQKAYDALLDMLGERDRACVIKPTGTGKFVIIAKMVQDNPDNSWEGVTSWWMPPTTSDTSGRAGRTVRLPTRSRRLPCSDGSNNGS